MFTTSKLESCHESMLWWIFDVLSYDVDFDEKVMRVSTVIRHRLERNFSLNPCCANPQAQSEFVFSFSLASLRSMCGDS